MPLQLGNGDHGYNNRAACGASDTAAVEAEEDGGEGDDVVKLDAEMAIAKKAAWKKTADEKGREGRSGSTCSN